MKDTLKRLSEVKAPLCVTLILHTHKTKPDYEKDIILLKNLIAEASARISKEYDAKKAKEYTDKLQVLADTIDHSHNNLGLMLFVNDEVAEYLRVPVKPTADRVILDETFATRTITRALSRQTDYYLLVLTKGKARLIEAGSDQVVREVETDGFPIENKELFNISNTEGAIAERVTNLAQEFFNRVDKTVNVVRKKNPLSVVIYSERTNYYQYLKVADFPNTILGYRTLQSFDAKAGNLVKEVWPHIEQLTLAKNQERIEELTAAINTGKYLGDLNEVWRAVREGRGRTIFVEKGYIQPVKTDKEGVLTPIEADGIRDKEDVNDIVDEMIEHTLKFGGDVVFVEQGSLEGFNKLALVTRY